VSLEITRGTESVLLALLTAGPASGEYAVERTMGGRAASGEDVHGAAIEPG
jgi:hypothetical protein